MKASLINIGLTSRYSAGSYAFAVKDCVHCFRRRRSSQVHSFMAALTCLRSAEAILTLTCPSPKSFVYNLPDSGRHVTSIFQVLSRARALRRAGRREPWEWGWLPIWFPIHCPLKKIVYGSWKVLKICLRASKRWLILSNSVRCHENLWSLGRCFDLCIDKHKCAFSLVEECHVTSWPCP